MKTLIQELLAATGRGLTEQDKAEMINFEMYNVDHAMLDWSDKPDEIQDLELELYQLREKK